jgi:ferredoxin-NADP reductase
VTAGRSGAPADPAVTTLGRPLRRPSWRAAELVADRWENSATRTLVLNVPGWPGHLPGQHVDVRLTADDGYQATRSYSIAAPADGDQVELTVQRVPDAEVSPYLVDDLPIGASIEILGPVGGWFTWDGAPAESAVLIAGGVGIVPLMAMVRARRRTREGDAAPIRLIYSLRSPDQTCYRDELAPDPGHGLGVLLAYTRHLPSGHHRAAGRLTGADLTAHALPPGRSPACYVCGPTGFVETASELLTGLGHNPARIRTERFGPSGG